METFDFPAAGEVTSGTTKPSTGGDILPACHEPVWAAADPDSTAHGLGGASGHPY